jgi:hypothetical protein
MEKRIPLNANIPEDLLFDFKAAMAKRRIMKIQDALTEAMQDWIRKGRGARRVEPATPEAGDKLVTLLRSALAEAERMAG